MNIIMEDQNKQIMRTIISLTLVTTLLAVSNIGYGNTKARVVETGVNVAIRGDVNRDGYINFNSQEISVGTETYASDISDKPFLLWINDDDDDSSETSGQDNPNSTSIFSFKHDYENEYIDGSRDLIDFFPVALDMYDLLKTYNNGGNTATGFTEVNYEFVLKHEDEAVNVVFTAMTKETANRYLVDTTVVNNTKEVMGDWQEFFGDDVNDVKSERVLSDGLIIPGKFITYVKETEGAGIILIEGANTSTKPLQLFLRNTRNQQEQLLGQFSLAIYPVTDFYRYVNLRGVETTPPTITATDALDAAPEPIAFSDADSNGKQMIAMHGYNVSADKATGWAAETFKRIWQTGSNAMFTFITWTGNKAQIPPAPPNYWTNVVNAFNTSSALAQVVNTLPGSEKSIMGHSLGNMVISDAIQKYNMQVNNYFMMDAAVALEAYDARTIIQASINRMRNPVWENYLDPACTINSCTGDKPNNRWLWSTEWYLLFDDPNDARKNITWRNVFANIFTKTKVKNYYSSTEEVLENGNGNVETTDALDFFDEGIGFRSWTTQEMGKGTDIFVAGLFELENLGELDKYGGWGFNYVDYNEPFVEGFDYSIFAGFINSDDLVNLSELPLTTDSALALTTDQIRNAPFFKRFNDGLNHQVLYSPKTTPVPDATVQPFLPHLLGHAIPALSDATGRNVIPEITNSTGQIVFNVDDNIDMSIELRNNNEWPEERDPTTLSPVPRWKHGDLKDVAYLYVMELYKDFVIIEANLNQ